MRRALLTVFVAAIPATATAQSFLVPPYLQLATPESIVVAWETDVDAASYVAWGTTETLGERSEGDVDTNATGTLHIVPLNGLEPETTYYYQVHTGSLSGEVHRFVTPPADPERSFRLLAMSDMQIDRGHPTIYGEIINEGVIPYVAETYGGELSDNLSFTLIPGDLVDDGNQIDEWRETFFAPSAALNAEVPVYPVYGNHERNTLSFTRYFVLPDNGSDAAPERWWWFDYANTRVIGLDSTLPLPIQLDWLDTVLADACDDDDLDFVFAQLHHPHLSELWLPGESPFTGEVVARMEAFTETCGKPSIHFFGHTHGYSRGQSRDHRHLWVNVATAGGAIDYWGEHDQRDYDEFTVSDDAYGFVLVDVEAGEDPSLALTRISRGDNREALDNVETDTLRMRRYNDPPARPRGFFPLEDGIAPDCVPLTGSAFDDPDGDAHQASHWQVAETCDDFSQPIVDRWRQDRNLYFGVDSQAGDALDDEVIRGLAEGASYCWRVRYRDNGYQWSAWSRPSPFETTESAAGPNLVVNPGAEDGLEGWTIAEGVVESLDAETCSGTSPFEGERYFAVGGVCEDSAYGELTQTIGLEAYATSIDAGEARATFGGMLSDYDGSDIPRLWLSYEATNLVVNPGAEEGLTGWVITEGEVEAVASGECAGTDAFEGEHYFALGALCGPSSATATLVQNVDLGDYVDAIDTGALELTFSAALADYNGSDVATASVRFVDGDGLPLGDPHALVRQAAGWRVESVVVVPPIGARSAVVSLGGVRHAGEDSDAYVDAVFLGLPGRSSTLVGRQPGWRVAGGAVLLPAGTREVTLHLSGERTAGQDNDSFFDAVFVRVSTGGELCLEVPEDPGPDPDDAEPDADTGPDDTGPDDTGPDDTGTGDTEDLDASDAGDTAEEPTPDTTDAEDTAPDLSHDDATAPADTAPDQDTDAINAEDEGCSCAAAPDRRAGSWLLLAGVVALVRRRGER